MASAVRHLRCLAHTWLHFALCPSGHWPRSAPEIRFAAIRNRRNPDTCDLSLPTPTFISHPPSRQNAASPKHPAVLDARANRSGARSCLSRARMRAFTHPCSAPVFIEFLRFRSPSSLQPQACFSPPALPMPLVRAASILFLALPRLRLHTFSLSLFRFARRIASVSRAPT
jgi:hypothetical protein